MLDYCAGKAELESALACRPDERGSEDVWRYLIERRGQAENLVLRALAIGMDFAQCRTAGGERSGLVEQQHGRSAESLERRAALDDDASRGAARQPGDDRHRRGKDQRAGCRYDQHGERAHRIAAPPPGDRRQSQGEWQKDQGIAVGEAHEGSLRRLRFLHQADDAGVGALIRRRHRPQVERSAGVDHAAAYRLAVGAGHRPGLAGQRRFVEHGGAVEGEAVDRDDLAGLHQQEVARPDVLNLRRRQDAIFVAVNDPRCVGEQRVELAARAGVGEGFESESSRQHEGDDRARGVLPHDERRHHGQESDDVDSRLASTQITHHGEGEREEHDGSGRRPEQAGHGTVARRPGNRAGENPGESESDEQAVHRGRWSICGWLKATSRSQSESTTKETRAQALFM